MRNQQRPRNVYGDYDLRNILICPEDVVLAVGDRPGQLAMIHPHPSQTLQVGDHLRMPGKLYRLEEFVCSMGFHKDSVHVYRITEVCD